MKKTLMIVASCALMLFAAGCKSDDKEPEQTTPATTPSTQPAAETLAANLARPTWAQPDSTDMTSSMTAVIRVDLLSQYPTLAKDFVLKDDDLLAAFAGEACLGVASPDEGLFYLYIAGPATGSPSSVTLRYYSAHYKNLFVAADAFPFTNDANLGTFAAPLVPAFVVNK